MNDNYQYGGQTYSGEQTAGLRVFLALNGALTLFALCFFSIALSAMDVSSSSSVANYDILGNVFVGIGQAFQFLFILLIGIGILRMVAIIGAWLNRMWGKVLLYIFFIAGILIGLFNELYPLLIFDIINLLAFYLLSRQQSEKRKNDGIN